EYIVTGISCAIIILLFIYTAKLIKTPTEN
ncbi:MAG: hypothetical protein ACI8RY_001886, partial [Urechidicola sp.]